MRKALLVIDVQTILFDPEPQPYNRQTVIDNINRLSAWCRAHGYPVIFIQHEREGSIIARGEPGWQLQADLNTESDDLIINKETSDSFLNTDLKKHLDKYDVSAVIACGYASEFCVDTTVRRAAALGYPVTLVGDAHTTHDKTHMSAEQIIAHHNITLRDLTSFDAPITVHATEQIIS